MHPAHVTAADWLRQYNAQPSARADVEQMLQVIETADAAGPSPFSREHTQPGHFTASAFVLSPNLDGLFLIYHGKLHRWLQPGGHIEASDLDIVAAARREASEEIGLPLEDLVLLGDPYCPIFDVDVHKIPARKTDPDHLHLDIRVLFRAASTDVVAGSDAKAVKAVALADVTEEETDRSVMRAVGKIRTHLAQQE